MAASNSTSDPLEFHISPAIPPVLAVICSTVAGLTSFGDAILFHVLWAIVGVIGWLPAGRRETLERAVLYLSFIPIANLLPSIYVSRKLLAQCWIYGLVMATSGVGMVNVGAYMLFFGDLTALKLAVGTFFILFSGVKLTLTVGKASRDRRVQPTYTETKDSPCNEVASPQSHTMLILPEPTTAPPDVQASGVAAKEPSDVPVASDHNPEVPEKIEPSENIEPVARSDQKAEAFEPLVLCKGRLIINPISPVYSPKATLAMLLFTGIFSGLLGGMFGTGGPPQMIAFALLKVDKDVLRAVSVVYGCFELGMRIYSFTAGSGNVFDPSEGLVYGLIIVAAWIGYALGTWYRMRVNTDIIITMLLCLVLASSAILLGALDSTDIATGFGIGIAVWICFLLLIWNRPSKMERCLTKAHL
jgi:hypothetical protein